MELDLFAILKERPEILLFLVIGCGYLLGKIKLWGFELGSAGGVLFAALFFGHVGLELPRNIETLGFIFFMYSVGFQAGPRFFTTFLEDGPRYMILATAMVLTGVGMSILLSYWLEFAPGYGAGLLAGAMTSTPTLAAAQDSVTSGMADLSFGWTREIVNNNITVGYAITYIFGLVGLILFMRLLPRMMGVSLPEETADLAKKMKVSEAEQEDELGLGNQGAPMVRIYKVDNEKVAGKTLDELKFFQKYGCVILKTRHDEKITTPGAATKLELGDNVAVLGYADRHIDCREALGPEIYDERLSTFPIETYRLVVTNPQVTGQTVRESGITNHYACFLTKLQRTGVDLPLSMDLRIEKGDQLVVTGIKDQLEKLTKKIGHAERAIHETDLLTFAFGIVGGSILGLVTLKLGDVPVGIGMAGGLLVFGLFIGYLRSRHPTFGRVPTAARYILMEMGMLFFLAGVGLRAGHGLIEGLRTIGLQVFLSGMSVTIIPVVVGTLVGKYLLKFHPVILLGAITGSLTSTPALLIVNKTAKSSLPALGYAGAYAFANILLTIAGQIIMLF